MMKFSIFMYLCTNMNHDVKRRLSAGLEGWTFEIVETKVCWVILGA